MFANCATLPTPFGDSIFRCTFFTNLSTKPTVSDGHIFLCVKKDMEERHAKGLQSRPLESGFFIRGFGGETCGLFYVCARVQLTRFRPARRRAGGVRFTRLRRKARHHLFSAISLPKALLPPVSIVLLQLRRNRNTYRITDVSQTRQSGGCVSSTHSTAPYPKGTSYGDAEASPSGRTPRVLPPVTLRVPVRAQHAERMEAVRSAAGKSGPPPKPNEVGSVG